MNYILELLNRGILRVKKIIIFSGIYSVAVYEFFDTPERYFLPKIYVLEESLIKDFLC